MRCELLDENQFRLLSTLLVGKSLGAACEELADSEGSEIPPVAAWFSGWVRDGLIARCEVAAKPCAV